MITTVTLLALGALAGWVVGPDILQFAAVIMRRLRSMLPEPPRGLILEHESSGPGLSVDQAAAALHRFALAVDDQKISLPTSKVDDYGAHFWSPGSTAFWLHPRFFHPSFYDDKKGRWAYPLPADDQDYDPLRELLADPEIPTEAGPTMPCGCSRLPPGVSFKRGMGNLGWSTCLSCGGSWIARQESIFEVSDSNPNSRLSIATQGVLAGAGGGQVTLQTHFTTGATGARVRRFRS